MNGDDLNNVRRETSETFWGGGDIWKTNVTNSKQILKAKDEKCVPNAVGKPEANRLLGRRRRKWIVKKCEVVDWIQLGAW